MMINCEEIILLNSWLVSVYIKLEILYFLIYNDLCNQDYKVASWNNLQSL